MPQPRTLRERRVRACAPGLPPRPPLGGFELPWDAPDEPVGAAARHLAESKRLLRKCFRAIAAVVAPGSEDLSALAHARSGMHAFVRVLV